jgi:hypothetical protein
MMTIAPAISLGFDSPTDSDPLSLERRVAARVRLSRPVRVIALSSGRHMAGKSRDVSSTGMRLELPVSNAIVEGEAVQLDIGSLAGVGPLRSRRSVVAARVVWVKRENKLVRPMLTAGVEFEPDLDSLVNVA